MKREIQNLLSNGLVGSSDVYYLRELRQSGVPPPALDPWQPLDHIHNSKAGFSSAFAQKQLDLIMPSVPQALKVILNLKHVDYVLAPPSKFKYAREIADGLAKLYGAVDLTNKLVVQPACASVRATGGATANDLIEAWDATMLKNIAPGSIVLLADDAFCRGETYLALARVVAAVRRTRHAEIHCCAALSIHPHSHCSAR